MRLEEEIIRLRAKIERLFPKETRIANAQLLGSGVPGSGAFLGGDLTWKYPYHPVICQGRLTLTSGTPVTTSDVTGAGTLYFTPFNGNRLGLYNGSGWDIYTFTERSLSLSGFGRTQAYTNDPAAGSNIVLNMTNTAGFLVGDWIKVSSSAGTENAVITVVTTNTSITVATLTLNHTTTNPLVTGCLPYDVFAYGSEDDPVLEAVAWTNGTTRATALTTQDGIYVKSGDATRRYLGTFMTTLTVGQTEDSISKRYLWNYYNQAERILRRANTTWHTFNTNIRPLLNDLYAERVDYVIGASTPVDVRLSCNISGATGTTITLGVGVDSPTTWDDVNIGQALNYLTNFISATGTGILQMAAGRHNHVIFETTFAAGASTVARAVMSCKYMG